VPFIVVVSEGLDAGEDDQLCYVAAGLGSEMPW
jgi:hypothetical protein